MALHTSLCDQQQGMPHHRPLAASIAQLRPLQSKHQTMVFGTLIHKGFGSYSKHFHST